MEEKFKILIVDDDVKFCQTLRDILEEEDFFVDEAHDGEEACEIMRKKYHNLIFMDIKMPDFDGFLTSLLVGKNRPGTELVFVTGYQEDEEVKKLLDAIPKSSWLKKPVDPREVIKIAKQHREKL
jgi:DNA-binding response OmpR family regulator